MPAAATTAESWLELFAAKLGTAPPTAEDLSSLLDLGGIAAHASERTAAPVSCWLVARAGLELTQAVEVARQLASELGHDDA